MVFTQYSLFSQKLLSELQHLDTQTICEHIIVHLLQVICLPRDTNRVRQRCIRLGKYVCIESDDSNLPEAAGAAYSLRSVAHCSTFIRVKDR